MFNCATKIHLKEKMMNKKWAIKGPAIVKFIPKKESMLDSEYVIDSIIDV
jgi:hypothetical protein